MEKKRSILEIIRKKVEKVPSMTFDPLRRVNSTGFGCVSIAEIAVTKRLSLLNVQTFHYIKNHNIGQQDLLT